MSIEISQKDKKLLIYLLALVIIVGSYQFGARIFLEKASANNEQTEVLSKELEELSFIYNNHESYSQKISDNKAELTEVMEKFPGGFTQENTILMLQSIEDNTGAWISKVDFSEEEFNVSNDNAAEGEATEETEIIEETEASETAMAETEDISAENIRTVSQNLSLDYACSYGDFKKFLDYVQNYSNRLFISSLTASYSPDSNEVSGSVVITQYAVQGAGKAIETPDLSGINLGTENIFTTLTVKEKEPEVLTIQVIENTDTEEEGADNTIREVPSKDDTNKSNVIVENTESNDNEVDPDNANAVKEPAQATTGDGIA